MVSGEFNERSVLDSLEPRWADQGYQVIREPSPDQLPEFLRELRPDAIAVGPTPYLVIDIIQTRGGDATNGRVRQLQGALANRPDWRLEVIYARPENPPVEPVSPENIREALGEARRLADSEPRAGLMLAWASLEAIGRRLEPDLASRSLSPRSLVDLLVSTGRTLRRLADERSAVAHGQLNLAPAAADVRRLVELGERLVA